MDREEAERYCSEMRDLFMTPGWAWLMAECEAVVREVDDLDRLFTLEQLHDAKGAKRMALAFISMPARVVEIEEQIEDGNFDEDVEDA